MEGAFQSGKRPERPKRNQPGVKPRVSDKKCVSPVGAKEKWYVALTGLAPLPLKDPAHARMSWAEVFRPVGAGGSLGYGRNWGLRIADWGDLKSGRRK